LSQTDKIRPPDEVLEVLSMLARSETSTSASSGTKSPSKKRASYRLVSTVDELDKTFVRNKRIKRMNEQRLGAKV